MYLSYIIPTASRPHVLAETLAGISCATRLPTDQWEICVVDNGTFDGEIGLSNARLIRSRAARPMAAANDALAQCSGKYVVVLSEDTSPANGRSVARAISHLERDPTAGAVVGRLMLPDDSQRVPALPTLTLPGATCFRKTALDRAGGFSRRFSGVAADYDLSFRICSEGFRIDHRDDIAFSCQRQPAEEIAPDLEAEMQQISQRLTVIRRFLPESLCQIYWEDWSARWRAIYSRDGHGRAIRAALLAARLRSLREILSSPEPATPTAVEEIFSLRKQAKFIGDWARGQGVWRVVLCELSDNIWATFNACRSCGIQVRCVADDNPAFENMDYRGLPIVGSPLAFEGGGIDGAIISASDPARINAAARAVRRHFNGPILRLHDAISATEAKAVAA